MSIKIEEGKHYITNAGYIVGPSTRIGGEYPWVIPCNGISMLYSDDGFVSTCSTELNIADEWSHDIEEPKLWCDMTDEEKGALLLAHHEGKVIEFSHPKDIPNYGWGVGKNLAFIDSYAYRIKPEPVPVRETVTLYWLDGSWAVDTHEMNHTHSITFETIDGEPECASIKMEKI